MIKNLIFIFCFLLSLNLYSQKINEEYYLFSNENISENLIFKNDSIVISKPIFRGGIYLKSNYEEKVYKYDIIKDTLIIYNFRNSENLNFRITKNYIENSERKEIYIIRNDFEKFPDLAVKFKDKIYWIDSPQTSNGVITKEGKVNRKVQKLFKNEEIDNLNFRIYRGYDAFSKFGFKYVFGIIDVTKK